MPIYEYRCRNCGNEFEVFKKISDPEEETCKLCNSPADKLVSLSSFKLVGSGWYVTDYGGKKPKATESKKETSSEKSSDAKEQD